MSGIEKFKPQATPIPGGSPGIGVDSLNGLTGNVGILGGQNMSVTEEDGNLILDANFSQTGKGKIKFKPSRYWIKSMSSPNKWKDGDPRKGEKFFGSSRWFVSLTDAWHVFGFVFRVSYGTAFLAIGSLALYNPLLPLLAIPAYALFAGVFHIFHTYKILRK